MAERALTEDLTAPGLLGVFLPPAGTVLIVAGATIALVNDLPAMLLAVSRLMFAWAEDGVFPGFVARVHPRRRTPHVALVLSGLMASTSILACQLAGDLFLGMDILTASMLVNFLVMCIAVLFLPHRNPALAREIRFVRTRPAQLLIGASGAGVLGLFLWIQTSKDLQEDLPAWYLHSSAWWVAVVALASALYWRERAALRRRGVDVEAVFSRLPPG